MVDQPATIGALPDAVAQVAGIQVAYLPGLGMRRIADLHPGEAKTPGTRTSSPTLHAPCPQTLRAVQVPEEHVAELSMLCGFADDLAKAATATSNRIPGLLTQVHPALERIIGKLARHQGRSGTSLPASPGPANTISILESTGLKLSDYVSDLMGMSSRAMLTALISGERDPQVLADLAKGRMRPRIPELVEALTGHFSEHHAFICTMHLDRVDSITRWVDALTVRIDEAMDPFRVAREFLATIPGVSVLVADVIVAETGADMGTFETPGRLASWAGLSPGSNESAGRTKSTKTRPGNRYLKGALGIAALNIARHPKGTYLGARYKRLVVRRGKMKAIVATEHSILTAVWHMLAEGECYHDPGSDFFTQKDPTRTRNNAVRRLHELGYDVTLSVREAA